MAHSNGDSLRAGVRQAIYEADELSRRAHVENHEPIAQALDGLRTALVHVDEALGGGRSALPLVPELERIVDELATFLARMGPDVRRVYEQGVASVRKLLRAFESELATVAESKEIPSRPLFGVLPLARVVSQDLHSVLDYGGAGVCVGSAPFASSRAAQIAGAALGASKIGVSLLSDNRLSAAKVLPIEAHEAVDHVWGASAIALPFVLGYWRKDPAIAALHVLAGATSILSSLFTDYRAAHGRGR